MENNKKPKVLVTYVEAGMGHIVSAQAIAEALKRKFGDQMDIIESYILRDSKNPILPKYEQYLVKYTQLYSQRPALGEIQFSSMHLLGAQNTLKIVHSSVFRTQTQATVEEYARFQPDVIVCTHYYLLFAAVEYKLKHNRNTIVVAYCPDNNVHGWWDIRADVLYTNNPLATKQAYDLKFKSGHVREAFYPTRSDVMEANESKEFYRDKFGIPRDKFAVVLADGAYAKAKLKKVCLELLKTDIPLTICVLAGKNDELKAYFDARKETTKPNITLLTYGFLKDAPQLYGACDLFITKAGPNAVLDSVMMGTPIITDYCATPIERATKKLFVEHMFCGYHFVNPRRIRKQVEKLVNDPSLLNEIREALAFFDKSKNGADEIAEDIGEILWNTSERMQRILREEEQAIYNLVVEKAEKHHTKEEEKNEAEKYRAKAEEKIEKVNEAAAKQAAKLPEGEKLEKLNERTAKKTQEIAARAEKKVEKSHEFAARAEKKAEKASKTVYDDTATSHYSAMVAKEKLKQIKKSRGSASANK